jgi:hypothetical protein
MIKPDVELLVESPSIQREIMEHKLQHEDQVYQNTWQSCCLTLDKRATQYFSQLTIIVLILLFCIYQLLTLQDCEPQQAYLGLLTLLIGLVIPTPQMNSK